MICGVFVCLFVWMRWVGVRCAFAGGFGGQDTGEAEVDRIGDRWRRGA
jgi:hypothetical protein